MKKTILTLLAIYFSCALSYSQNFQEDSLLRAASNADCPGKSAAAYMSLSKLFRGYDLDKSLRYAETSLSFAEKSEDASIVGDAMNALGIALYYCDDYVASMELFIKAKDMYMSKNDKEGLILSNIFLGNLHSTIGDNEVAMSHYNEALSIYDSIISEGDSTYSITPSIYSNIAITYSNMNNYDAAIEYIRKAIDLAADSDESYNIENEYINLANIYIHTGDMEEAIKTLDIAEKWCEKHYNLIGEAMVMTSKGDILLTEGDYDRAMKCAGQALSIGQTLGSAQIKKDAYSLRSKIYREMHDYKNALSDYIYSAEASDSLFNIDKAESLQKLRYTSEYKMREQKLRYDYEKAKLHRGIMLIIVVAISIICILMLLVARSKMRSHRLEKEALKKDLELKNKELISKVMSLMERNEILNSVTEDLIKFRDNMKGDNKKMLQDIISNLRGITDKDLWSSFEVYFNNVYESFYTGLKRDFPDLTPGELKICALLRLNLSSKEIAAMFNQSAESIDVTRTRIRKKLNLTGTGENLTSFLLKY